MSPRLRTRWLLLAGWWLAAAPLPGRTLLEGGAGTVWKFMDEAQPPAAAWTEAGFDDAGWKAGAAPLGYGDPGLGTTLFDRLAPRTWSRSTIPNAGSVLRLEMFG